jgi:hypothetical protein
MKEAGEEEKGWGVSGLGTSSKLLESNAKEMLGGCHPSSPAITAFWERGWRLAEAKKP